MDSICILPTEDMDFWNINSEKTAITIKWSKNCFEDYKELSYHLYVVDAKSSDKRRVKTAINDLKRNGGHVIGVVLNKVDMSDENRYGYGYGYGYGGDDDGKKK